MTQGEIERHLARAERLLVDRLGLRLKPIPSHLSNARGLWKDAPVAISTRAYEGNAVAYMRVALVVGSELAIGSLLAQGRPNRGLPILGADLAWLGAGRDAVIDAGLTPVREAIVPDSGPRAAPADPDHTLAAFDGCVDAFLTLAGGDPAPDVDPDAVRSRYRAYADTHRADPQVLGLLGAMFGKAWTEEYVRTVLFPG